MANNNYNNPNHNNNNNNLPPIVLNEARNIMLGRIDRQLTLFDLRHLNQDIALYEIDSVYLHIKIMFSSPNEVELFLDNYCNIHGVYATQMFLNIPLQDSVNHCTITAMDCATLWNTDPYMIRVLYRWGANIHIPNVNGIFIGDGPMVPYCNYLSQYVLMNNNNNMNNNININNNQPLWGARNRDEFEQVLWEIEYIGGERVPPNNWHRPQRIYRNHLIQ
jgi:hypothetical protein